MVRNYLLEILGDGVEVEQPTFVGEVQGVEEKVVVGLVAGHLFDLLKDLLDTHTQINVLKYFEFFLRPFGQRIANVRVSHRV